MGEVRRKLPVIFIPFTGQLSAVPPTAWKLLTPTHKASYLYDSSPDILIMLLVLVGSIHWFHVSVLQEVVFQLLGYNLSCTVDNLLKKQNKTNQKSHYMGGEDFKESFGELQRVNLKSSAKY